MKKSNLLGGVVALLITQTQLIADVALFIPTFTNMDYYSKDYRECYVTPPMTTSSIRECMKVETERQEALLDKEYNRAMNHLSDERKKTLREAQTLWVKYRDANCSWYNNPDGGTSASVSNNQCYLNMTVSRLIEMTEEGFHG